MFTISILSTSPDPFEMLTNSPGTITTAGNCKTTYVGIPQVDRITLGTTPPFWWFGFNTKISNTLHSMGISLHSIEHQVNLPAESPVDLLTEIFDGIESELLHVQGGDSGQMDSRAQRYCGSYFDSSEGSTRNGQVTSECRQEDEGKH